MLRPSHKNRFLSRVALYTAVIAILWAMEKAADAQKTPGQPAPIPEAFLAAD